MWKSSFRLASNECKYQTTISKYINIILTQLLVVLNVIIDTINPVNATVNNKIYIHIKCVTCLYIGKL